MISCMTDVTESPTQKLRIALEMFSLGTSIMRSLLRRQHPKESPEQIEERLRAWLETRPGAEFGDAPGRARPVVRPREGTT